MKPFDELTHRGKMQRVGCLMAQLHAHAASWTPPQGFTRLSYDWDGLFGDGTGTELPGCTVWQIVPPETYESLEIVSAVLRRVMDEWGKESGFPECRAALLEGYAETRSLPNTQMRKLPLFLAAVNALYVVWPAAMMHRFGHSEYWTLRMQRAGDLIDRFVNDD